MKTLLFLLINFSLCAISQTWELKNPYPALGRDDGVAFSLDSYGYCVTGNTGNFSQSNLLYQYDPNNNAWTKKTAFPAEARQYCTVFTIDSLAYLVGGYSKSGNGLSEVWCYNSQENSWTQKNDFAGGIRWGAFSFSIAGYGYFGCGTDVDTVYSDFWEYDPITDKWTQLDDFIGGARREAVGCSSAGIGMAGTGFRTFSLDGFLDDWYIFDPKSKQWEVADNYPGGNIAWGKAEAIGNKVIVGSGMDENQVFKSAFYQFNILERSWQKTPSIPTGPIRGCSSFSIDNTVYFTTGLTELYQRSKFLAAINYSVEEFTVNLFPNPSSGCFHLSSNLGSTPLNIRVFDVSGKLIREQIMKGDLVDYSDLGAGLYLIEITTESNEKVVERLLVY